MESLKIYLSSFIHKEEKKFDNELDSLYYKGFLMGQNRGVDIAMGCDDESSHKSLLKMKMQLDSYLAQRSDINRKFSSVEEETENDGYLSGIIYILNESYMYMLRQSSITAKEENSEKK